MKLIRKAYLRQVTLRRTHDSNVQGESATGLPDKTVNIVELDFDEHERSFYDSIEDADKEDLGQWYQDGR